MNKDQDKVIGQISKALDRSPIVRAARKITATSRLFEESAVLKAGKLAVHDMATSRLFEGSALTKVGRLAVQDTVTSKLFEESAVMKAATLVVHDAATVGISGESQLEKVATELALASGAFDIKESRFGRIVDQLAAQNVAAALDQSDATSHIRSLLGSAGLASIATQQLSATHGFDELTKSPSFVAAMKNSLEMQELARSWALPSFQKLAALIDFPLADFDFSLLLSPDEKGEGAFKSLVEFDEEIAPEVMAVTQFNDLPQITQARVHLVLSIMVALVLAYHAHYSNKADIEEINAKLDKISTSGEARSYARSGHRMDRLFLNGYRVTIGDNVYLREGPAMSADIMMQLPVATLLDVLDKSSHRSWLQVEVEVGSEVHVGWVARRYTKPLR